MEWYLKVLKKYGTFSGRACRTEYWMFFLFNTLFMIALSFVEGFLGIATDTDQSVLSVIYSLAVFIPSVAVTVRRMHDTDHSGWWGIVPIASLVIAATKGTEGPNRFGADPKGGIKSSLSNQVSLNNAAINANDSIEKLKIINNMYEAGLITQQEYISKRQDIISKL